MQSSMSLGDRKDTFVNMMSQRERERQRQRRDHISLKYTYMPAVVIQARVMNEEDLSLLGFADSSRAFTTVFNISLIVLRVLQH